MDGESMNVMPFLQKILPFLVATTLVEIVPPKADQWRLINDQTERGGASTGKVLDVAGGIEFTGSLGSIPGNDGEPVAFSLARIAFKTEKGETGLKVTMSSMTPVVAQIVLGLAETPRSQPTLTYQKGISLDGNFESKTFSIPWSEFQATVRGKRADKAPVLDPSKIESWAIQVTRSSQPGEKRYEPIDFRIRVLVGP